ncbi:replication initiation protein [Rothia sp. AR01]|uniref:Replication initiation protein n=1 Tax=Rothia santali TaxID=2949643 RepID=A0A9X2HCH5_9MICC|nr:replication initiation protein [Rothia santali]MCP3425187.1 replication initiation protein [Rothia santali]
MAEVLRAHHRLVRFSGGHEKNQAHLVRGDSRRYPFIQLNHPDWMNFICVDVDEGDGLERLLYPGLPRPHAIVTNPANGHAQGFWMIDPVYIGEGAAPRPRLFFEAVRNALTNAAGGDPHFTGHLVRNPFAHSPAGEVTYSRRAEPWALRDLKKHLTEFVDPALEALGYVDEQPKLWNPVPGGRAHTQVDRALTEHAEDRALGRNCAVFYATRTRLWKIHRDGRRVEEHAHAIAHQINSELPAPLGGREVDGIAASAIRQVHRGKGRQRVATDAPDAYLSALGRRGGRARTAPKLVAAVANLEVAREKVSERALERAREAARLRRRGEVASAIARALECDVRTVRRYFRRAAEWAQALLRERSLQGGDTAQATGSHRTPPSLQFTTAWNLSPGVSVAPLGPDWVLPKSRPQGRLA